LILTTGYYPQWGATFVLFPREGMPVLFNPVGEPHDTLPDGVEVRDYTLATAGDPWMPLVGAMRDALADRGLAGERIAYVPANQQSAPPVNSAEGQPIPPNLSRLLDSVSAADSVDITPGILNLFLLKTTQEVERIRRAQSVAAVGIQAFYAALETGKTEAEVASAVESAVQNTIGRQAGVWFARAWAFIQSGANAIDAGTFSRTTGRKLAAGELVVIECAVCVNGYWADITRTGAVRGRPVDPTHEAVFAAVHEAQSRAVRAVGPGAEAREVDRTARDYLTTCGFGDYFPQHLGHHTGLRYHDPGPVLSPTSQFRLAPGMIVTIEPGVYGASLGTGCRIEDNVLVTEDGFELLSTMPRSLNGT
jgi:Xaa-Pro dipeptidase